MQQYKEAMYYKPLEEKKVQCFLCPHNCKIMIGGFGACGIRKNIDGKLYSLNYGKIAAIAMDPVEKKPLYHFYPGKKLLSIGTMGCNFCCGFCQNHHIAQMKYDEKYLQTNTTSYSVDKIIDNCREEKGCIGVAYTYNEPSIWYEYVLDTSKEVKKAGYKNILVTNGYISEEPLIQLLPYIDAMNIDIKAFNPEFYKRICKGKIESVLDTVKLAAGKTHVEITTLIIPDINDNKEEMSMLAKWLGEINPSIPLHITRYFPRYKMYQSATSVEKLMELKEAAEEYLKYVYIGNISETDKNTYCPECGNIVIGRSSFNVEITNKNICQKCGFVLPIVIC